MSVDLLHIVDLICLVYHEARNVRHPIKAGKLADASKFARLLNLPTNRDDAWRHMSSLRNHAVNSGTIEAACKVFEQAFGVGLKDLVVLYEMPIWKHSAYGGNKWAGISSKICHLVDAMKITNELHAPGLYRDVLSMDHNTGRVADKLRRLNS